jgi:hypothetical protein
MWVVQTRYSLPGRNGEGCGNTTVDSLCEVLVTFSPAAVMPGRKREEKRDMQAGFKDEFRLSTPLEEK